jgi:hypothetical protein
MLYFMQPLRPSRNLGSPRRDAELKRLAQRQVARASGTYQHWPCTLHIRRRRSASSVALFGQSKLNSLQRILSRIFDEYFPNIFYPTWLSEYFYCQDRAAQVLLGAIGDLSCLIDNLRTQMYGHYEPPEKSIIEYLDDFDRRAFLKDILRSQIEMSATASQFPMKS